MIYQWTAWNCQHIGEHSVTPDEAQFVADHAKPPFPRKIEDQKLLVWGQTATGRYLQVIFVYLSEEEIDILTLSPAELVRFEGGEEVGFIIHAMDMTPVQKRQYRRAMR